MTFSHLLCNSMFSIQSPPRVKFLNSPSFYRFCGTRSVLLDRSQLNKFSNQTMVDSVTELTTLKEGHRTRPTSLGNLVIKTIRFA